MQDPARRQEPGDSGRLGVPRPREPRRARIEEAALAGGVTLHGSGIHPGGITERFPLMVSSLSSAITHVRAEEFSDIRTYNAPLVVREVMGFGLTPEKAMSGPIAALLEAGFKASVRMVTDQLGFRAEPRCRGSRCRPGRADCLCSPPDVDAGHELVLLVA